MKNHFPVELLEQTDKDRLNYFRSFTVGHSHLIQALKEIEDAMDNHDDTHIALVLGCTGSGKTTLIKKILQKVITARQAEAEVDKTMIPIVSFEAIGPESGSVNMKVFMKSYLKGLKEPLINEKDGSIWEVTEDEPHSYDPWRDSFYDLEDSAVTAVRYRRPVAIIIDEAHLLTKVTSAKRLQDHLNVLKTIANKTQTLHILVGTYELLPFRNLSGQLSRRSVDVHLRRYRYEVEKEFTIFKNVIHTFEAHMPLWEESHLIKHADFLYERSIGCVGILKVWLKKAFKRTLKNNLERITFQNLEATAHTVAQCQKMATEALEGESQLIQDESSQKHLQMLLGIVPPTATLVRPLPVPAGKKIVKTKDVGKPLPQIHKVGCDSDQNV